MCQQAPRGLIYTKFVSEVGVPDVITCTKFIGDRLREVDLWGIEDKRLPLTKLLCCRYRAASDVNQWLL